MKSYLLISIALSSILMGCVKTTPKPPTDTMDSNREVHAIEDQKNSKIDPNKDKFIAIALDEKTKAMSHQGRLFNVERFQRNGIVLDKINLPSKLMFGYDQYKSNKEANLALEKLVQSYKSEFSTNYIYIVGHTDSDGPAAYNMGLSSRRSMNVVKQLQDYGVGAEYLYVIPAGENMPMVANDSSMNKAKNRRVEIYLSQSRDLALQYIRDAACPESVCRYAKVSILKVDRDFGMTNNRVDFNIPESVVIMESDFKERSLASNKKTRDIKAFPILVRDFTIIIFYRDYTPLPKDYLIKPSDKRRQRLANHL
jgi:outer membrane protein OmpA-like peptidoglycan-associated protein